MRIVALIAIALLPGLAAAGGLPSAANSSAPSHVIVVGRVGALADTAFGAFTVVVRYAANNPVAGATVEVRLLNCDAQGIRLSSNTFQAGVAPRCATHAFTAVTDATGSVRMTLVGGGTVPMPLPGTGPCATIYADGLTLRTVSVAWLDLDGIHGVGVNDIALWLEDLARNEPISRTDYDGDGSVTPGDLSLWLEAFARAGSLESAASYCP